MDALRTTQLTKAFGELRAVDHVDLRVSEGEVLAVNLGGMRNVLDLCRRTGARLFDVSTAYVCGTRAGRVNCARAKSVGPSSAGETPTSVASRSRASANCWSSAGSRL